MLCIVSFLAFKVFSSLLVSSRADLSNLDSLSDVPGSVSLRLSEYEFRCSRWWTRGWTLQELLAPSQVLFFVDTDEAPHLDLNIGRSHMRAQQVQRLPFQKATVSGTQPSVKWRPIGTKTELSDLIASITGIDIDILDDPEFLETTSIAQRMSWASSRVTSRPEDMAYCLMGLFDVHMPMLYGEGAERAFLRLQEEIMASSDDQSLFAWRDENASPDACFGLLATSPRLFRDSSRIVPYQDWQTRPPYQMTNRGLQIGLPLTELPEKNGRYWAALDCPVPPDYEDYYQLAICLEKLPGSEMQFARVMANQFSQQRGHKPVQQIYVRQQQKKASAKQLGVFPRHVLQMHRADFMRGNYRAVEALTAEGAELFETRITSTWTTGWLPDHIPKAFKAGKVPWAQVAGAILFEREEDGERLLVRVGSAGRAKVGFDAVRLLPKYRAGLEDREHLRRQVRDTFVPQKSGQSVELKHHLVRVTFSEPRVLGEDKYILFDMEIEAVRFADRILPSMAPPT